MRRFAVATFKRVATFRINMKHTTTFWIIGEFLFIQRHLRAQPRHPVRVLFSVFFKVNFLDSF